MDVLHLTADNFEQEVLKEKGTVLVDFWATWCGPCRMLTPVIETLAKELDDVKVAKIDVDQEGELAEQFKVLTIPTLIVFKNGVPVSTSVGVKSKAEILEMLKA